MLESMSRSDYDEAFQQGFEIGVSEVSRSLLTTMTKYIKIYRSEERWERFKRQDEAAHRKYLEEHPESGGGEKDCYDADGHIIEEKWVKRIKDIMDGVGFPKGCWDDICVFIERYPDLSPKALAGRIIRESEYKYI